MRDEEFTQYFLQSLPDNVYDATIQLCDRFLERHLGKALSYKQYLYTFSILKEFLDEHNVLYSIPKNVENQTSNYKITQGIGEFFQEIKQKMQLLHSQEQFIKKPLSRLWSQKYEGQSTETLQSLPKDILVEKVKQQDAQTQILVHLLVKQLGAALKTAIDKPNYVLQNQGDSIMINGNNSGNNNRTAKGNNSTFNQGDNSPIVQGNNNTVVQGNNNPISQAADTQKITATEVVEMLASLEEKIQNLTTLPETEQQNSIKRLEAAKVEVQESKPDKESIVKSLKRVNETLKEAGQTSQEVKELVNELFPTVVKFAGWLGCTAGKIWMTLP